MAGQNRRREGWLRCRLSEGMFNDEFGVTYPPEGESELSIFIESRFVKKEADYLGRVRVGVLEDGDKVHAVLPSEYSEVIRVRREDLVET